MVSSPRGLSPLECRATKKGLAETRPSSLGHAGLTLVVPVVMADHKVTVVIAVVAVPATMPATVMIVKPNARPAVIAVAVIARLVAINANAGCISDGRGTDCKRRCRRKGVSELFHLFLLCTVRAGVNLRRQGALQEPNRNFFD